MTPHGRIHWTELNTWEPEKAMAYYAETLGWTFEKMTQGDDSSEPYWIAKDGDAVICGIMPLTSPQMDGVPASWMTYFAVDDIDAAVAKTVEAGGTVMSPVMDVAGVGRFAVVQDAANAVLGVIQPAEGMSAA